MPTALIGKAYWMVLIFLSHIVHHRLLLNIQHIHLRLWLHQYPSLAIWVPGLGYFEPLGSCDFPIPNSLDLDRNLGQSQSSFLLRFRTFPIHKFVQGTICNGDADERKKIRINEWQNNLHWLCSIEFVSMFNVTSYLIIIFSSMSLCILSKLSISMFFGPSAQNRPNPNPALCVDWGNPNPPHTCQKKLISELTNWNSHSQACLMRFKIFRIESPKDFILNHST